MTTKSVRSAPPSPRCSQSASAHFSPAPRLMEHSIDGQINAPAPAARHVFPTTSINAHTRALCMHKSEHCSEVRDAR